MLIGSIFCITCTLFKFHFKKFLKICFILKEENRILIIAVDWSSLSVTNKECAKIPGLAVLAGYDAV